MNPATPANPLLALTPSGYLRAHNATLTGDVTLGPRTSVWFNAVIRGDVAPIRIGARVNVQDLACIHCDSGQPNTIEDDVSIGHGAIVHGVHVGAGTLIGMGAKVLGRTRIGKGCLIAAGAVLTPGTEVPDGMLAIGVPAKIARPVSAEEAKYLKWLPAHYAELAERYARGEIAEL